MQKLRRWSLITETFNPEAAAVGELQLSQWPDEEDSAPGKFSQAVLRRI